MGWCSGQDVLSDVWTEVRDYIPDTQKEELFTKLVKVFQGYDMDCYDMLYDFPEGKTILEKMFPLE